jgi:hypothetical protein
MVTFLSYLDHILDEFCVDGASLVNAAYTMSTGCVENRFAAGWIDALPNLVDIRSEFGCLLHYVHVILTRSLIIYFGSSVRIL